MKLLPQITRSDLTSLGFRTSLEIAAGGVLTTESSVESCMGFSST